MESNYIHKSKYNIDECKNGIVHIGVGNFHRAHQAFYVNKYLEKYEDKNWGIIGINLRNSESKSIEDLKERNGKYVLKTISTEGIKEYEEIQSITSLYDWSTDDKKAESVLGDPNIKIVTMTVTETGYYINAGNEINADLEIVKDNINKKEKTIIFSYLHNALNFRKKNCSLN